MGEEDEVEVGDGQHEVPQDLLTLHVDLEDLGLSAEQFKEEMQ